MPAWLMSWLVIFSGQQIRSSHKLVWNRVLMLQLRASCACAAEDSLQFRLPEEINELRIELQQMQSVQEGGSSC